MTIIIIYPSVENNVSIRKMYGDVNIYLLFINVSHAIIGSVNWIPVLQMVSSIFTFVLEASLLLKIYPVN